MHLQQYHTLAINQSDAGDLMDPQYLAPPGHHEG